MKDEVGADNRSVKYISASSGLSSYNVSLVQCFLLLTSSSSASKTTLASSIVVSNRFLGRYSICSSVFPTSNGMPNAVEKYSAANSCIGPYAPETSSSSGIIGVGVGK